MCTLIAVGSTVVTLLLSDVRFFKILNAKAFDSHFLVRGQQPTSDIVLVTADQKALDTFKDELQMFWHLHYADVIHAAERGGAKVLGLDLAFGIPVERWVPGHDQKLAEAVATAKIPVVVGYVPAFNTNQTTAPVPVNMLAAGMGLAGFSNLTTDSEDDFIRRQELLEAASGDEEPPQASWALRVTEKFLPDLVPSDIPLDANRAIYINYAGGPGTFPRVSMADVVTASDAQLKQWFQGKIVLVGTDYAGDSDRRNTPFFTLLSGDQWRTAGVEVHANTIHTLLTRNFLLPARQWARIGAILAATAGTVAIATEVSAGLAVAALLVIGFVAALATHLLFRSGTILSTSEIMLAATLAMIAAIVYRFVTAEQRGDLFREAVSLFVGKRVAASLDDSRTIGLTGKRETVTILFTDIRGFTAYTEKVCEEQGPEFLVQELNKYMGMMAAIIVTFGGHVNKFIGDGILAVFSDEDEGAIPGDHPLRAVRCATRMVNAPSQFQTGAGLHTGLAVVGNVGSADKMEYTVLGDTVNLAARLESLNKEHKTKLLMSETTQQALNGSIKTTHLGAVPVRGKAAPIGLYTLGSLLLCALSLSAAVPEEPIGLVLNAGGSQLLRSDAETPLSARPGDLLFSGDGLRTSTSTASFLFCPGKTLETLSSAGEVRLDASKPKVRTGSISGQPARACTLPKTLRVAAASQQHYGVTMTRGVAGEIKPVPRTALPADAIAELAPFDAALAANPNDQAALIGAGAIFESRTLPANALEMYYRLRAQWPDAAWLKSKIFDLEQAATVQTAATASTGGQTYALLIGVSKYQRPELSLQYAHSDAATFSQLLTSPRAGGVPASNILLLTDEKATTAAVRNGFQDFLKRRATKNDTVIILIAGHGTVETPGNRNAYILTHDSDPQDLASTALPMAELQALFEDQLQKVGKVLLFVDVCKAGTIGSIQSTGINSNVQQLGDIEGDLFGLLASRPRELSFEGPEFGGGHGAFSYFVMKGMGGAADADGNKTVTAAELIDYVSKQVPEATNSKQHPREFGVYDNSMRLAEVDKPGIDLARTPPMIDVRTGEPLYLAQASPQPLTGQAVRDLDTFSAALAAGRILPDQSNNAFDALRPLANSFTPQRYLETQNQLRIALENAAQRVLLKYLQGDQTPPVREDFALAARYMDAARTLTRESLYLEARDTFFQGRALLFDKRYTDAAPLLEQSVRLDPGAAYSYNALGISYLEQARFDEAIPAFRDATNRAQHWSYPLHNLALSYVETGDYQNAIRAYERAIALTPEYSYLPYNLGLVYQRLNRAKDAEKSYRRAMQLAPASAEAYNALGTLKASQNKSTEAEQFYRDALQRNPALLPARHNLAVLLAAQPARRMEAVSLLRDNVQRAPQFLASQLSLAEILEASADTQGAIQAYRQALALSPRYTAARLALARLLLTADPAGAAAEAQQTGTENSTALELLGDARAKQSLNADARSAYQSALALQPDRADRKRIEKKLQALR